MQVIVNQTESGVKNMDKKDTLKLIARIQHMCSNPILPTAYSESLSYIQQLACFSDKLNEVIERLNAFTGDYESYVQEQLKPFTERLTAMEEQLATVEGAVDTKISQLDGEVATAIKDNQSYVNSAVTDLRNEVNQTDSELRKYVDNNITNITNVVNVKLDAAIKQMETYVTGEISKQLSIIFEYIDKHNDDIKIWVTATLDKFLAVLPKNELVVINPITGVVDTLQNTLNAIANACKWNTLNCNEWDALQLTVDKFDAKVMTAYTIDWMSREKLLPHKWAYMYNPFSGLWVTIESVVNQLADFHKTEPTDGAITATDYDKAQLTAQAFDDLSMTAYMYDWHARRYIRVA